MTASRPTLPTATTAPTALKVAIFLAFAFSASAWGQGAHVGAGLGPTVILDGGGGTKQNVMGFVGLDLPGPLGLRLEGNETASLFLLTGNVTLSTPAEGRSIRTYLVAGLGAAIDMGDADTEINAGLGLALPLVPGLRLFSEVRVHRLLDSARSPRTILPITFGLRVGG